MQDDVIIREFATGDLVQITEIYGHAVLTGTATFEEQAPSVDEMHARLSALGARGFPVLVAAADARVLGYAYAGPYGVRSAYRFTVEDSIYIAEASRGQGVGRKLMMALIDACHARDYAQMIAVIGDSGNGASIGLHKSCGFATIGTARNIGFKFNRWLDVVYMQRSL